MRKYKIFYEILENTHVFFVELRKSFEIMFYVLFYGPKFLFIKIKKRICKILNGNVIFENMNSLSHVIKLKVCTKY